MKPEYRIGRMNVVAIAALFACMCVPGYTTGQEKKNDCLPFFYHYLPNSSKHDKFSSVTETKYICFDSLADKKALVSITVRTFNSQGQELNALEKSGQGHTTDSVVEKYDAGYNLVYDARWDAGDTSRLKKEREEMWVYDKNGNVLMDSSYEFMYDEPGRHKITKYEYDNKGNEIKMWEREDEEGEIDTTIQWYRYDAKSKVIFEKEKAGKEVTLYYYSYDNKGQQVFYAEVDDKDSASTITKYDNKGNVIENNKYTDKSLIEVYTMKFDENKRKIETTEEVSTADPLSCPNNSITVKVSDSTGRQLSEVITRERDGNPIVTTIIDKYYYYQTLAIYGAVRKFFIDSTFGIEKGFMYYEKWKEVYSKTWDAKGNLTENTIKHGNNVYPKEWKNVWKYNDENNEVYTADYSSCSSTIPYKETISMYYPGGKNIKEVKELSDGKVIHDTYYDKNGRETWEKSDIVSGIVGPPANGKMEYYVTYYEYK